MRTKIYFIRHGETVWNTERRYQGWTDIELSPVGLKQSELLGERFKNIKIDKIYVSPLKRARQTAEPMAKVLGIEPIISESFKEINFGEWEGGTVDELKEKYGDDFIKFFENPAFYPFPGDGSFKNVEKRMAQGLEKILVEDKGKSIAIVSHGGLLKILFLYIMGLPGDFYRKVWIDNTAISLIEIFDNGKPRLRTFNDIAHLENFDFK